MDDTNDDENTSLLHTDKVSDNIDSEVTTDGGKLDDLENVDNNILLYIEDIHGEVKTDDIQEEDDIDEETTSLMNVNVDDENIDKTRADELEDEKVVSHPEADRIVEDLNDEIEGDELEKMKSKNQRTSLEVDNRNEIKFRDQSRMNASIDEETVSLLELDPMDDTPMNEERIGGYILFEKPEKFEEDDVIDEDDDEENKDLKAQLFSTLLNGDANQIRRVLESGAVANATCLRSRITACHFAAFLGKRRSLRALIRRGADPEKKDILGRTPMHFAVWKGYVRCVQELIDYSKSTKKESYMETMDKTKNVHISDELAGIPEEMHEVWANSTSLHIASARISIECLDLLIKNGENPKMLDLNCYTPLDVCGEACKKDGNLYIHPERFEKAVKILIEYEDLLYKPAFNAKRSNPLHKAVYFNKKDVAKMMAEIAAYRCGFDESGQTPLHAAIEGKKKNLMPILMYSTNSEKFDLDFANEEGLTPLQLSIKNKWRKGETMLIKAGAELMLKNKVGDTALHIAASGGSNYILQDIIKSLTDKTENINCKNRAGETALIQAIRSGHDRKVDILIREGASLEETLKDDSNVLHEAVKCNHMKILKLLVEANSNLPEEKQILNKPNSLNEKGMTALHLAVSDNKYDCVKILIENGADIFKKTLVNSQTVLHIAAEKGHLKMIELLIKKDNALMNELDYNNWKPFYSAVHKGHRDCITYFLQNGADLSEKLMHRSKRKTVMQLLVNNLPRSVNYLDKLFDSYISKNECEINDDCCEITIDYSILVPVPQSEKRKNFDNQMSVVVALLDTGIRFNQRTLLLHPYIESFLYMKWMTNLRKFYLGIFILFLLYVLSLSWTVMRIYRSPDITAPDNWSIGILGFFVALLCIQELLFIRILKVKNKLNSYFRRKIGTLNWMSIILTIFIMAIDHTVPDRIWAKLITASAVLLAWLQITILLSHFPQCAYILQMFTTVASRALKVIAIFGIYVIIGFALAFLVMFHGLPSFNGLADSLTKTIVMTSEFEYEATFETIEKFAYRLMVQLFFVLFIFIVPIVMMNLILALIISDTKDLEIEGKIMRLTGQVHLIDILDTVTYYITNNTSAIDRTVKIYPGKPKWEAISLVSKNIEESLFSRVGNKTD